MSGMWTGDLLAMWRPIKLPWSRSIGGEYLGNKAGLHLYAARRRPASSTRRKLPPSARHRRTAPSMMVCHMGCRSCGELAMARSTSEIAARCAASSATCCCSFERDGPRQCAALPPRRVFSLFIRRRSSASMVTTRSINGSNLIRDSSDGLQKLKNANALSEVSRRTHPQRG
jgi:hypothetical protein